MTSLPRQLILLNNDLSRKGVLSRLGATGAIRGKLLKERHYDEMIVSHQDVFADALREAGLISGDSELLHLGNILGIDALFAEVEAENGTFRRFVIAEDKLFRNPDSHREVLGQILDYSRALRSIDPNRLSELLPQDKSPWVDANEDLISPALKEADFLLVVCGDEIQRRLIEYLDHLKDQLDPLIAADLALVSVAIFSNGTDHLLIPHVVGAMVKSERPLTIRVMVTDTTGAPVAASVSSETRHVPEPDKGREKIELTELLDDVRKAGDEAREIAESLFQFATKHGAVISLRAAAASVRVWNLTTDKPCTVFVVTRRATFYTGFVGRWEANAGVGPEVAREYEATLTNILDRSPRMAKGDHAGNKAVPLVEIGRHRDAVFAAIGGVIAELRESRPATAGDVPPNITFDPTTTLPRPSGSVGRRGST
jgi:hypothetical protein